MVFHKNLTQEKWNSLTKTEQILNIASELMRVNNWIIRKNNEYKKNSLDRVLELVDLTIGDKKWRNFKKLRELLRFRELIAELYIIKDASVNHLSDLIKVLLRFDSQSSVVEL